MRVRVNPIAHLVNYATSRVFLNFSCRPITCNHQRCRKPSGVEFWKNCGHRIQSGTGSLCVQGGGWGERACPRLHRIEVYIVVCICFQEKLSKNGDADSMECFVCFETINTQELSVHIDQHNPYIAKKVSFPLNWFSTGSQHSMLLFLVFSY